MDFAPTATQAARGMKILGHRRLSTGGLVAAAPFLDLVVRLRGDKPFIPKGLHRFKSFEESEEWSMAVMARPPKPSPGLDSLGRRSRSERLRLKAVTARSAISEEHKLAFETQADAPACHECGSIMVRNGSCYRCLKCGATSGCS